MIFTSGYIQPRPLEAAQTHWRSISLPRKINQSESSVSCGQLMKMYTMHGLSLSLSHHTVRCTLSLPPLMFRRQGLALAKFAKSIHQLIDRNKEFRTTFRGPSASISARLLLQRRQEIGWDGGRWSSSGRPEGVRWWEEGEGDFSPHVVKRIRTGIFGGF